MRNIVIYFGLALGLATTGDAEVIPGSQISYGNWSGAAYSSDASGEFSHCAISAEYVSGNSLYFFINRDSSVSVGVSGELGLVEGQQFPVALYVDRRKPFYGTATALDSNFATLTITDFDAAMRAFQRGYNLQIEALGTVTPYSLKGTFRALEAARRCAVANYEFKTEIIPQSDKTFLFQLSTMMISELGVDDFRYLSETELVDRDWSDAVAWESEVAGITGLALIFPRNGLEDLRTTDAADTQFIAKSCEGDYATSARGMNLGEAAGSARELRLICDTDGVQSEIYLSKFLTEIDVVYMMLIFEDVEGSSNSEERRDKNENVMLRAAKFVSE